MQNKLFPENFIWGAATAAYQIEGAVHEDGRKDSIWDYFSHTPGNVKNNATGDIAADHYHRLDTDIALMKELELKAYRFSISWPRVLPDGYGAINNKGLDFYKRLVDKLRDSNIEPFITLYHWDLPMALQNAGGWLNRRCIDWFTEYAQVMYKALGDKITYWCTHNEPNVSSYLGYKAGIHAPGVKDDATFAQVVHHILLSHGDAVAAGRAMLPSAQFGIAPAISQNYPETEADTPVVKMMWNHGPGLILEPVFFGRYPDVNSSVRPIILNGDMERISQKIDFIGINHYFSMWFKLTKEGYPERVKKDMPVTDRNWIIYPQGMIDMLHTVKNAIGNVPIYITENGASYPDVITADGCVHDSERTAYYKGYISAAADAINQGIDLRGYFAWSLIDNFEWEMGYDSRFGIVHVDFETQKRTVKDSGKFFATVIKNNGVVE